MVTLCHPGQDSFAKDAARRGRDGSRWDMEMMKLRGKLPPSRSQAHWDEAFALS